MRSIESNELWTIASVFRYESSSKCGLSHWKMSSLKYESRRICNIDQWHSHVIWLNAKIKWCRYDSCGLFVLLSFWSCWPIDPLINWVCVEQQIECVHWKYTPLSSHAFIMKIDWVNIGITKDRPFKCYEFLFRLNVNLTEKISYFGAHTICWTHWIRWYF